MSAKPIPDGYYTVTPYLIVDSVDTLVTFLKRAFDAKEKDRLTRPDGSVMHIDVQLGDSVVMMGEPMSEFEPMASSIYLYVQDCDAVSHQALATGGVSVMEVTEMYHAGERYGGVKDPAGNLWWIANSY